jgi:hypothetical protein
MGTETQCLCRWVDGIAAWDRTGKDEESNPHSSWFVSSCHSLRETHENPNFVLVKIPIEIQRLEHGPRLICMDSDRLQQELGLNEEAIGSLVQAGLVRPRPQKLRPKPRIDYAALQQSYARLLSEGGFSSRAEFARHLGISRVWVSRVLKGIKRKAS